MASESTDAPSTVLLCGAYQFDPALTHPVLRTLPDVLHLPARVGRHRALRAAVDLLGDELADPRPGSDACVTRPWPPPSGLSAVARRVGYSSEYAFAAAFKRAHGVPPGRYRTASRRAAEEGDRQSRA